MKLILRIFINAVAIWVTSYVLPGLEFEGNLGSLIIVGVIFGLVNALIRPVVKLLALPITILTLGLFTLVINAAMLLVTAAISSSLTFTGSFLDFSTENTILNAIVGAILISIVSTVLSW
ncbi:MAG: phage holin family protein, partial [Anaerolineales bacterium]